MGDQANHKDICKFNQTGFCKFGTQCDKKHNNTICEKGNTCCEKLCSERHPKLCRNFSNTGICRHKENCAYEHPQENKTKQGFFNDAIMVCMVWQQQQITALSEEVKCLKLVVENINKERKTVETVYPNDKEVIILEQQVTDKNMDDNINIDNKIGGKVSPDSVEDANILVHKVSEECYKCKECDYRSESEMSLNKHNNTKHQYQKTESVKDAKFFCHECNTSYKTKKCFKKHMDTIHDISKSYSCDTCKGKFTDKSEFDKHKCTHKHNQDNQAIQISSMTVGSAKTKCHYCKDDSCDSCLNYWLAKAKEISMGLAIS